LLLLIYPHAQAIRMVHFIVLRLLHTVLILFGVSIVAFGLIQLIPGNPLDILLPPEAPKEVIERLKVEFGFDQPLYIQYLTWLGRVLHGNLGTSVFTGLQVTGELLSALGNTFVLAVPAALLGFSLGTTFGTLAAFNHGRLLDKLFSVVAILGLSMPHYWLGIALVVVFAVMQPLLPAAGMGGGGGIPTSWEELRYLILPVVTLSMIPMGVIGRMVRSTVLEILSQEFPTALRAKGLRRRRVVWHVLKNAAPPALAVMGLQLGYLLGGSILVETVFNWPGSGQFMNLAIFRRDIPVLQGTVLVLASFFVMINLLVDVIQALIDPRIRR
jgi:peptide/nickel transport system permease protein